MTSRKVTATRRCVRAGITFVDDISRKEVVTNVKHSAITEVILLAVHVLRAKWAIACCRAAIFSLETKADERDQREELCN